MVFHPIPGEIIFLRPILFLTSKTRILFMEFMVRKIQKIMAWSQAFLGISNYWSNFVTIFEILRKEDVGTILYFVLKVYI